jgi:iron complex outermembrane receptor protein
MRHYSGWQGIALLACAATVTTEISRADTSAAAADEANAAPAPAPAAAATVGDGQLEEITVTARRREESLERVPVAIVALDSRALTSENVNSQEDLQRVVSGLIVRESQQQNDLTYAMRGQTTDAFSGVLPGVLPYINEIQLNSLSAGSIYDMSSVQVLKGPQGTLFGRNVTGGAVVFTTAKPTNDLDGYVTLSAGNYHMGEAQGAVNLPIAPDTLALRLAGDYTYRGGYVHDLGSGDELGVANRRSGRATLLATPEDNFTNQTTFQYDKSGGNNVGQYAYSVYPIGATNNGIPLSTTAATLFSPNLDNVLGSGAWANYLATHPNAYPGGVVAFYNLEKTFPAYTVWQNEPSDHDGTSWFVANTSTLRISDALQIKNIAGFSKARTDDLVDLFGAPYPFEPMISDYGTGYHYATDEGSDELQLSGVTFGSRLTYIGGLYLAYQKSHDVFNVTPFDIPGIGVSRRDDFTTRDLTYAFYAQGTYDTSDITHIDGLSFTLGGRYGWDKDRLEHNPTDLYYGLPDEAATYDKPSWQVGLEYQVNTRWLVYLEQRGSWRSGGFNGTAPAVDAPANAGGNEFLPETVRDVEIGSKFAGEAAGIPVRLNVAAYYSHINNVQRVEYVNVPYQGQSVLAGLTANIPDGKVDGVEMDFDIRPWHWLRIGGNAAFTDAEFTNNVSVIFGQREVFGPFPDSPKWAGTVFGEATAPTPAGPVMMHVDVYKQTYQYFSSQNSGVVPGTQLPGYALLGARLEWRNVFGSKLTLAAFGKNLTDKFYFVGGLAQGGAFGINGAAMGVPRMYGAQATYDF